MPAKLQPLPPLSFASTEPALNNGPVDDQPRDKRNPEEKASCLAKPFFWWELPFLKKAYRLGSDLEPSDLTPIRSVEEPLERKGLLLAAWQAELKKPKPSLLCALWVCVGPSVICTITFMFFAAICNMINAFLLGYVVQAVEREIPLWHGYAATACIVLASCGFLLSFQQGWHNQGRVSRNLWSGLTTVIFEKPALLSSAQRAMNSEGEVINLMSVDCQTVFEVSYFFALLSMTPFMIVIACVILVVLLGESFFVGFAILCVNTYIVDTIGKRIRTLQREKNAFSDERSLLLNESLQGIRTVKLYAWEAVVQARVFATRKKEIKKLELVSIYRAVQFFMSFGVPTVAQVATFIIYERAGNALDAGVVFRAVALFELLNTSLVILPNIVNELRRAHVSVIRLQAYMLKAESFKSGQQLLATTGPANAVSAGPGTTFIWEDDKAEEDKKEDKKAAGEVEGGVNREEVQKQGPFALRDINFEAHAGELVAVVGQVGSGKSTLGAALLGLVTRQKGEQQCGSKRTAYVPQNAFILNDTVRANIIFGKEHENDQAQETRYQQAIDVCALGDDLLQLPGGDMTEVGEKGITISGGQKQRVALARAAFSDAEVIVCDDALSAMDAHISRVVFEKCILGMMKDKTRVFITNQLAFTSQCDRVYVLRAGEIVQHGSYQELVGDEAGEFYRLSRHVSGAGGESDSEVGDTKADGAGTTRARDEEEDAKAGTTADDAGSGDARKEKKPHPKQEKVVSNSVEKKAKGRVGLQTVFDFTRAAKSVCLSVVVLLGFFLCPLLQWQTSYRLALWIDAKKVYTHELGLLQQHEILNLDPTGMSASSTLSAAVAEAADEEAKALSWYFGSVGVFTAVICIQAIAVSFYFLRASENLHNMMLTAVLNAPMWWFDTTPVGRLLNRFTYDTMMLDIAFPRLFEIWSQLLGCVIITIVLMCAVIPHMVVVSVFFIVVFFTGYYYYGGVALEYQRLVMISVSPILASFSGFYAGLDTIRAFGRTDFFVQKFSNTITAFMSTMYHMQSLDRLVQATIVLFVVSTMIGALCIAVLQLRDSEFVTGGKAGLLLAYGVVLCFRAPGSFFLSTQVERMMNSVQRLIEYIEIEPEEKQQRRQQLKANGVADSAVIKEQFLSGEQLDQWPVQGTIEFKNVCMSYQPHLPNVLKGISFEVKSGERVGVVGRTGAGKSSVVLCAFRMVGLSAGTVRIGGVDIARVPLAVLRSRLGMIPQDSYMFSGTIRSNLVVSMTSAMAGDGKDTTPTATSSGGVDDERLWEALEMVDLKEAVQGLAGGLDAEVKEKGTNFSVGTVQLMCLARVLLKRPSIIFMDEATASVDVATDTLVQKTIRRAFAGCTIVTIAHRLQTVIDFDRILVLSKGTVAETGSPHELLEGNSSGLFAQLVDSTGAASAKELRAKAAGAAAALAQ
jgi:ABC-type multidrug transport system fused ATPase/permease subunit